MQNYTDKESSIRCIYSTATPFAYHGIGIIAYHAARALYSKGMLKKLLCLSHKKTEIPEDLIHDIFFGGRITAGLLERAAILLGSANGYGIKNLVYDNCASGHIDDCDIFHGWALESLKSLAAAKKKGARFTIIERPNSHILKQKSILEAEYKKYNLRKPIDSIEVDRNIISYEKADYVIVPSKFAYESFLELGFDSKKLEMIPYGYDPQIFKPVPRMHKDNIFRVLFCGSITLRKGVPYLLEAWDRLKFKDAELILAGRIFNDTKPILKKYINKNSSIKIKNFISYKEIVNQYQQSDVFAFPSLEEGFALVISEAMACGLPVITTYNAMGALRDGIDGFVIEPGNNEQLCEKLQYFYDNRQKAEELGRNGSECIKNYTWDCYSEKLCNFYQTLFNK